MIHCLLDYNYKKDDYSVEQIKISKTVFSNDEIPLIRLNIWYPHFKESYFEEGTDKINSFFCDLADEFSEFITNKLSKRISQQIDHPYSAVMRFVPTFENENYVSIIIDTFIYTDKGKSKIKRNAFTFDRSNGSIVLPEDIYKSFDIFMIENFKEDRNKSNILKLKKAFESSSFYLVPNGLVFFSDSDDNVFTKFFEKKNNI